MDFNRSFEEILKSVENIFIETNTPLCKIYGGSNEWNDFRAVVGTKRKEKIHYGLSKFVIDFSDNDNFVVKIPFAGVYTNFEEPNYEDFSVNHCKRELEDYLKLKDTEIGFLLAPTYFVGKVGELEVYIQPKVEPFRYENNSPSEQTYDIISDLDYYECTADDDDRVAAFVEAFGVEKGQRILGLLDEFGIRDIHTGNFGYQYNNLVIFDYCGYHN